jgi:hypothetical protein
MWPIFFTGGGVQLGPARIPFSLFLPYGRKHDPTYSYFTAMQLEGRGGWDDENDNILAAISQP